MVHLCQKLKRVEKNTVLLYVIIVGDYFNYLTLMVNFNELNCLELTNTGAERTGTKSQTNMIILHL